MDDVEDELPDFVTETFSDEEIDPKYEFDAPGFFDLSRAETASEAGEAERWFEFAGNYPQSPFIIKLNWRQRNPIRVVNTLAKSIDVEDVEANNRVFRYPNTQDRSRSIAKGQVKSTISRNSTLLKPTASHLAKQNHFSITSRRLQKKLGILDDKSSQNSSVTDDLATKRQKLEAGFSSKGAQLRHQALWSHKTPKKARPDGVVVNAKFKATIPREFNLETAHRAERRRCKAIAESAIQATFSANGTSRKEKYLPVCSPHSKTSEGKRRQEKCKPVNNLEACFHSKKKLSSSGKPCISRAISQGLNFPTHKRLQDEPPIHLFSKLCLTSEPS